VYLLQPNFLKFPHNYPLAIITRELWHFQSSSRGFWQVWNNSWKV